MRARRNALAADVVVVNHHLFFADVVLRDEGISELLPACNTVIFDEAHQLPGDRAHVLRRERVERAARRARARRARWSCAAPAAPRPSSSALASRLEKAARELRLAFGDAATRLAWSAGAAAARVRRRACKRCNAALKALREPLAAQAERSEGSTSCARRAGAARRLARAPARNRGAADEVRWVEVFSHAVQLHATPLSSAELFQPADGRPSARLDLHFGDARRRRGLRPFHARARPAAGGDAPLGEPVRLRAPGAALRAERAAGGSERGGVHRRGDRRRAAGAARRAADARSCCSPRCARCAARTSCCAGRCAYPLLVQGTGSRSELLARFRALGNAVLLGSQSFWEGVDVRGEALSVVVIDKLPFAPPDDPVLAARIEAIRARGGNPFTELQLPQAVLQPQAGRRPADPRRDRPRRADAVRPAAGRRSPTGGRSWRACRR